MAILTAKERTSINTTLESVLSAFTASLYSGSGTILQSSGIPCIIARYGVNSGVVQDGSEFVQRSEYILTFPYGTVIKTTAYTIDAIILSDGTVFTPISYEDAAQGGIRLRVQCLFTGKQAIAPTTAPRPMLLWNMNSSNRISEIDRIGTNNGTYTGTWESTQISGFSSVLYPNSVNKATLGYVTSGFTTDWGANSTVVFWVKNAVTSTYNALFHFRRVINTPTINDVMGLYDPLAVKIKISNLTSGTTVDIVEISAPNNVWVPVAVTMRHDTDSTNYLYTTVYQGYGGTTTSASSYSIPMTVPHYQQILAGFANTALKPPTGEVKINGAIQNFQVFDKVLTQAEIEAAWYYNNYTPTSVTTLTTSSGLSLRTVAGDTIITERI